MKKYLSSLMLAVVMVGAMASAGAVPVVALGSSYSLYIEGSESDSSFLGTAFFDAVPATAPRAGLTLTLSESETVLDGDRSQISIHLSANGDLFPDPADVAILAIGTDGNGLDLLFPVLLYDARVTFRNGNAVVYTSGNLASSVASNNPWTGYFPAPNDAFGFGEIGAQRVSDITIDFFVTDRLNVVPEPGTLLVCSLGLCAMLIARRRQRDFNA